MADVTVSQFAEALKVPVDKLLAQLDQAGISVAGADDLISEDAKLELLTHLRRSHGSGTAGAGSAPARITLKRKTQSELKLASTQGRARTVSVEVRVKRTYVKRDVLEEQNRAAQEQIDAQRREAEAVQEANAAKAELERRERESMESANRRLIEEEQARVRAQEEARRQAELRTQEEAERQRRGGGEPRREEPTRPAHAPASPHWSSRVHASPSSQVALAASRVHDGVQHFVPATPESHVSPGSIVPLPQSESASTPPSSAPTPLP